MSKYNIFYFMVLACCIACKTNSSARKALKTGYYGDYLEVVNSKGFIQGQFEYADKWNEQGFFENVCAFYFYSTTLVGDTIPLIVGLPGIETTYGKLILHGNDSITLITDYSSGYGIVDFQKGYSVKLRQANNDAVVLGIIKSERSFLYSSPNEESKTKSYLIKRDFVSLLQMQGSWVKIKYISPSGNKVIKWAHADDLYDANPQNWI